VLTTGRKTVVIHGYMTIDDYEKCDLADGVNKNKRCQQGDDDGTSEGGWLIDLLYGVLYTRYM